MTRRISNAIGRHSPEVAATARRRGKLRAAFPGPASWSTSGASPCRLPALAERGAAVFSLVLYPRWVRFFFRRRRVDDPEHRLEGTGSRALHPSRRTGADPDDRYIRGLMTQALKVAGADLKTGKARVVLKSRR